MRGRIKTCRTLLDFVNCICETKPLKTYADVLSFTVFCDAIASCNHDAGIFLSLEDAGKTKDVSGLHEQTADDGRAQRPLRGPNARRQESSRGWCQISYRRKGKQLTFTPPKNIYIYFITLTSRILQISLILFVLFLTQKQTKRNSNLKESGSLVVITSFINSTPHSNCLL